LKKDDSNRTEQQQEAEDQINDSRLDSHLPTSEVISHQHHFGTKELNQSLAMTNELTRLNLSAHSFVAFVPSCKRKRKSKRRSVTDRSDLTG
jgi:hypothetical protein